MDRKVLVTETHLEAIADAIREKLGTEQTYKPPDMAAAIESIKRGTPRLISLTATTNGVYDSGGAIDGYSDARVAVPTFTAHVTDRAIVIDSATVTPESIVLHGPKFVHKEINADGTYRPQNDGADAYSSITVKRTNEANEVTFYDYDGSVVMSYSAAQFLELSAMPDNPEHEGLVAQGWNWTLADAKSYVQDCGRLNIGQMYVTDDGKTRIYIHLNEGRTSPMLGICPNGTIDVDWGDGTAHDTLTGTSTSTVKWTPNHDYVSPGDYVIKLTVTGSAEFYGSTGGNSGSGTLRYSITSSINAVYQNSVQKIEVGNNIIGTRNYAFSECRSLSSITIPNSVTSISDHTFAYCKALSSITIPNSVTNIRNRTFDDSGLISIAIPRSVTIIGGGAFWGCSRLTSITIPNSVTGIDIETFAQCNLKSVTIPNSVTIIGEKAFYYCDLLQSITVPSSVTSVDSAAFQNCFGLGAIRFNAIAPPVVRDSIVFSRVPNDCIIYVPAGSLAAYTSAANYPDPTVYTYVEE